MKKGISILLVLSLVASMLVPFPVLANIPPGVGGGTASGDMDTSGEIDGSSGVVIIDTFGDVLGGSLPTAGALDFVIDPLGLLALSEGDVVDLDARNAFVDFNPANVTDGDTLYAFNASSAPVLLTVELGVTVANATVVDTAGDIGTEGDTSDSDADRTILLWMEPNAALITDETYGDTFAGIGEGFAFDSDDSFEVHYRLEAKPHELKITSIDRNTLEVVVEVTATEDAKYHYGTGFRFGGMINPHADWGQIGSGSTDVDIAISVVFKMELLSPGDDAIDAEFMMTGGSVIAYGLLDDYTVDGGEDYTAPTLIDLPVDAGASNVIRVAAVEWFNIPSISHAEFVWIQPDNTNSLLFAIVDGSLWVEGLTAGTYTIGVWTEAGGITEVTVIAS